MPSDLPDLDRAHDAIVNEVYSLIKRIKTSLTTLTGTKNASEYLVATISSALDIPPEKINNNIIHELIEARPLDMLPKLRDAAKLVAPERSEKPKTGGLTRSEIEDINWEANRSGRDGGCSSDSDTRGKGK